MEYTYPQYFYDFQCEASKCSDTCCTGWKITIDPVTLKKYREYPGDFGSRLHNSVNWKKKTFEQCRGRCAFLNEKNLCDIYAEAGKGMLCKTCTRYPRHYEEYENLREVSLSLSCPAAAKLILGTDEKMNFQSFFRRTPEEEYEQFDFFLFGKLQEIRSCLYQVVQNRELDIDFRMALALAVCHDLQARIDRQQLHKVDGLLKRYQTPAFLKTAEKKFAAYRNHGLERRIQMRRMWRRLYRLVELRPGWLNFLKEQEHRLYHGLTQEAYEEASLEFDAFYKEKEYEYEQLLMYFLFTYFCGAVYDRDAWSKVKFSVVSTLLIKEIGLAVWLWKGKSLTFADQVRIAHRYSREVEHSEFNLNLMETMLAEEELFGLSKLLKGILK